MADHEGINLEEIQRDLQQYLDQLQQVEKLLLEDPDNEEYSTIYYELKEAIETSEEILRQAGVAASTSAAVQQQQPQDDDIGASAAVDAGETRKRNRWGDATAAPAAAAAAPGAITTALQIPSILPASVAQQIRMAQQRAALRGQAPAVWAIGAQCKATWSDGQWYNAVVDGVAANGNFIVTFEGFTTQDEVDAKSLKPRDDTESGYRGVAAPKMRRVEEQPIVQEIPAWLEVKPTDNEKTKLRKRKLQKSYKSKIRLQKMDNESTSKQQAWKSFLKGKGSKKKTGFLTSMKKESIFAVPMDVNAKVGVIGSGKGMTQNMTRTRHEFAADDDEPGNA